MPVVPMSAPRLAQAPGAAKSAASLPPPSPTFLAMAAAQMNKEGRLFKKPKPSPEPPPTPGA